MKLLITVDTEADNQWKREEDITLENIPYLERFQELCDEFNFPPTYLLTYEVADDGKSSALLKSWHEHAEIGAHLHPWTNPPHTRDISWERTHHPFPSDLDTTQLEEKMKVLTERITEQFGKQPTSFRAGRWGFDTRLVRILRSLGYVTDCSVTPHVSWKNTVGDPGGNGGPDFRRCRAFPYELSEEEMTREGTSGVLELPMTILPTGLFRSEHVRGYVPSHIISRPLFHYRWFRIFPETTLDDLQAVYDAARFNELPMIEFMIHSSELMPGGSPYAKTPEHVEHIYKLLRAIFTVLRDDGVTGSTLSDFALSYRQ